MLDSSLIVAALGASGRVRHGRPWATPQKSTGRRGSPRPDTSTAPPNPDTSAEKVRTETTPRK